MRQRTLSLVIMTLGLIQVLPLTPSENLTPSFRLVTSADGEALCAVGDWLAEFTAQPASGGTCVPLAAQCGWACSKTENCSYFNSWTTTGRCQLFTDETFNASSESFCALFKVDISLSTQNIPSDVCESAIGANQSNSNCSFPFTYRGQLCYSCIGNISGVTGKGQLACRAHNWTWAICPSTQERSGWFNVRDNTISEKLIIENITTTISIPNLSGCTNLSTVNGWIIFQQRLDSSTVFNRSWIDYRDGFGSLGGNYWIGNEKVHLLTQAGTTYRLRIEMLFTAYGWMSAEYDQFSIDNESSLYRIHVTGYSNGECGDSLHYTGWYMLWYHDGMNFTSYDRDNDLSPTKNCAAEYAGGWWFNDSYYALLNSDTESNIGWWTVSSYAVTKSRMMMKPA